MKRFILIVVFAGMMVPAESQVSVNYYFDGNTLGISTSPNKKFWGEFRVNTTSYIHSSWSYADRGITQVYFCFKLASDENAALYSGLGAGVPLLSEETGWASINIPLGIQLSPFKQIPGLFLTGEYNGMAAIVDGVEIINTLSFGFKYLFQKK